jgi:hypothetical protein
MGACLGLIKQNALLDLSCLFSRSSMGLEQDWKGHIEHVDGCQLLKFVIQTY